MSWNMSDEMRNTSMSKHTYFPFFNAWIPHVLSIVIKVVPWNTFDIKGLVPWSAFNELRYTEKWH